MKALLTSSIFLAAFVTASCQPSVPSPTGRPPTQSPSTTPAPPATPTITPTSTATITPTPTIEAPPPLSEYLIGPKVMGVIRFDSVVMPAEYDPRFFVLEEGHLRFEAHDYEGGFGLTSEYSDGHGVLYDFTILPAASSSDFEFETYFDNGVLWQTDDYRRFGIYQTRYPESNLWLGKRGFGNYLAGTLSLRPNVMYQLLIAIGQGGDFLSVVWDPNDPDSNRYFHQPMGGDWAGQKWRFWINGAKGIMLIDNLMQISFDGFR